MLFCNYVNCGMESTTIYYELGAWGDDKRDCSCSRCTYWMLCLNAKYITFITERN